MILYQLQPVASSLPYAREVAQSHARRADGRYRRYRIEGSMRILQDMESALAKI